MENPKIKIARMMCTTRDIMNFHIKRKEECVLTHDMEGAQIHEMLRIRLQNTLLELHFEYNMIEDECRA